MPTIKAEIAIRAIGIRPIEFEISDPRMNSIEVPQYIQKHFLLAGEVMEGIIITETDPRLHNIKLGDPYANNPQNTVDVMQIDGVSEPSTPTRRLRSASDSAGMSGVAVRDFAAATPVPKSRIIGAKIMKAYSPSKAEDNRWKGEEVIEGARIADITTSLKEMLL